MPGKLNEQQIRQTAIRLGLSMFDYDFSNNAHEKSISALDYLCADKKWEEHWLFFLEQMVYQSEKPSFKQAIAVAAELNFR